ncbi:MAG: 60 kDa chaperonin [Candidatus Xenolissoclinum pacificiensis L6]|uniref:60 kDa chaperonin n=1 Tax=Candidatus Xenolissoclinum pacificiensis L6 TaxID=1401685 RepID=W2UZF3_9RICK|nr:MAG: 60 kDa chaperonin [Candidatus Xenolissoclinum pacificiensis L6]
MWSAIRALDLMCDPIYNTLGPAGHTAIIPGAYEGAPYVVSKDGYAIADTFAPDAPMESACWSIIHQSVTKQSEAGDGTSSTTLLTMSMLKFGGVATATGAVDMREVFNGLDKSLDLVLSSLDKKARSISTEKEIAQIASLSANSEIVGEKLAYCISQVGKDGVITIDEAKSSEPFSVNVVPGMSFDRGFMSPHFTTDEKGTKVILEDCYVLLIDKKVTTFQQYLPIFEECARKGSPLLLIAVDLDPEPLVWLTLNKVKVGLKVCSVKAPGFGDSRKDILEDIRIMTGAKYIFDDTSEISQEEMTLDNLGRAKKIVVSKDMTVIVDGEGSDEDVKQRIKHIEALNEDTSSEYEQNKYKERISKLSTGVATLSCGGATEAEMKELKYRTEDALYAVKSALQGGVVPGGGVALLNIIEELENLKVSGDENIGVSIMKYALQQPFHRIISNAGLSADLIKAGLVERKDENIVYNVIKKGYADAYESGVMDPVILVKSALKLSVSVCKMILGSKNVIAKDKKKDSNESQNHMNPVMPGMGGF